MKIERTKNATRGIAFGGIMKLYQMIVPFCMRTALIYFMGVQYLGLNSLFTSVLQVLNLAELGVGNAMVFSMYKPIAEDDHEKICALMGLYRTYYRIIGLIVGMVGLILTPFIPNLIKGDVPAELDIYVLYLLNLAVTVLTYWLFAYKNSLLLAHQRTDITSILTLVTNTLQYGIQLFVLIFTKNYYHYVIALLITQIINNLLTAYVVERMFPQYKPSGKMDETERKKINQRIKDLFTGKLGAVLINSGDTIVISAFLGLKELAVYQNYNFIMVSIIGFIEIIINSIMAGLGNSFVTDTKEKNYADLEKFTFMFMWLTGWCACCFLCLYQIFMKIWVGPDLMLGFSAVVLFSIYFIVYEINRLLTTYKDAAGLWHEDRFRPLITAIVNLTINLLLVRQLGIYGIKIATVSSMLFVGQPWLLFNMFTVVFEKKRAKGYILRLLSYVCITLFAGTVTYFVCELVALGDLAALVVKALICFVVPNVIFVISYYKNPQFRKSVAMVDKITKNKLHLEKMLFKA